MVLMKRLVAAASLLALLATMAVYTRGASAQAGTPEDIITGFFDAINTADYEGARALVADDAIFLFDDETRDEQRFTRDEFLSSLQADENQFVIASMATVEPGTINVLLDATGTGIYPFSADVIMTVQDGLITSMVGVLAEPLSDGGGVAPQPGMPTTGSPGDYLPTLGLLAGALSLMAGLCLRRRAASHTS